MPPTEPPPGMRSNPALLDVTFEDVRQSFLIRLQGDEIRLGVLRSALGSADDRSAPAFVELGMFAHRLRGAAAMFNLPELRDAAKEVELAAGIAAAGDLPVGEPLVQEAVEILATRLARLNGN